MAHFCLILPNSSFYLHSFLNSHNNSYLAYFCTKNCFTQSFKKYHQSGHTDRKMWPPNYPLFSRRSDVLGRVCPWWQNCISVFVLKSSTFKVGHHHLAAHDNEIDQVRNVNILNSKIDSFFDFSNFNSLKRIALRLSEAWTVLL